MSLLRLPEPYDFELSTARYRAFGPDRANLWHEEALHRVVDGRDVRIAAAPGGVDVEPLDGDIEPVVRTLLGAEFDLASFYEFARGDTILGELTQRLAGLRPPLNPDPFETLVTSITAQQVSLHAAFSIRNRLIERYGEPGAVAYAFPARAALAEAREDDLAALGFSRRKAEYVVGLAASALDLHALAGLSDEEVKEILVGVRGLGEWTADWFLARHLARPRAWPAGDLAVRKAVSRFYGDGSMLSIPDVRELGARFEPFQNLAAHYLLAGLAAP
ncbi:MAG: DNA-3-methyladenine glycosylase [Gaiellaceae bacterium]|nr:DNA-3-methyladenine glycosylase [Gaiellaceae bacterium]